MLRTGLTRFEWVVGVGALAGLLVILFFHGGMLWLLLSIVCSVTGLMVGLGVSFPHWQLFGPSLCRVDTTHHVVALTFDDGPDPESTPALLELLARHGIRATFFCIGSRVTQVPELARRMAAEGHLVENHSWAHSRWTNLFRVEQLHSDVAQTQAAIQSITGRAPLFFRPPMGLTNQRVFRVTAELGLQVVGYTARGRDRRNQPPSRIAARLLRRLEPGAIFLLHDGGVPSSRTLEVVRLVLKQVENRGYRCVRLDELAHLAPGVKPLIEPDSIQH